MHLSTCGHASSVVPRAVLSFILSRRLSTAAKTKVRDTQLKRTSKSTPTSSSASTSTSTPAPSTIKSSKRATTFKPPSTPLLEITPPDIPQSNPISSPTSPSSSALPSSNKPFSPLPANASLPSYNTYRISHPLLESKPNARQEAQEDGGSMRGGGEEGQKQYDEEVERNGRFTVYLGVSGGVDSSVSALLLKLQGFNVVGVYMKCWDEKDEYGVCQGEQDLRDAQDVCKILEIPFKQVEFVKEYWHEVFTDFLEGYKQGITPNPDVLCNKNIKFQHFLNYCLRDGADFVATGHYARVSHTEDGRIKLMRAVDVGKDQSYFLSNVNDEQLKRVMFPIGNLVKTQVRQIAAETDLPTAQKKNSVGLCFVGKRSLPDFLSQYIDSKDGQFRTVDGKNKGVAKGYNFLTIGQRPRISGQKERMFISHINHNTHVVTLCEGDVHPALYYDYCVVRNLVWINGLPNSPISIDCTCQVRYHQTPTACKVTSTPQPDIYYVQFSKPQKAVTPGQTLVMFNGEECIGGGEIYKTGPTYYEMKKFLPPGFVSDE